MWEGSQLTRKNVVWCTGVRKPRSQKAQKQHLCELGLRNITEMQLENGVKLQSVKMMLTIIQNQLYYGN